MNTKRNRRNTKHTLKAQPNNRRNRTTESDPIIIGRQDGQNQMHNKPDECPANNNGESFDSLDVLSPLSMPPRPPLTKSSVGGDTAVSNVTAAVADVCVSSDDSSADPETEPPNTDDDDALADSVTVVSVSL